MPKPAAIWNREIIDLQVQLLGKFASFFPGDGKGPFNIWDMFYEKEIKPLLKAPPVGLARYYQERSNQLMDKFNSWNKAWVEFLSVVSGPLGESLCAMQRGMEHGPQTDGFADGLQSLYQDWIKQLDSLYQNLFRSPEFVECLSNTVEALEGFVAARTEYVQDLGKALQLPTMKDLDEAYRELYLLKKEVKAIRSRDRDAYNVTVNKSEHNRKSSIRRHSKNGKHSRGEPQSVT